MYYISYILVSNEIEYRLLFDRVSKNYEDFVDYYEIANSPVITFVRVTDTDSFYKARHGSVEELPIAPHSDKSLLLNRNVYCIYWESKKINHRLEADLVIRAQSRFGDNYKFYRKYYEY